MTGFEFLPLTIVAGCFALTSHIRARSAERRAAGWEGVARNQGDAIERLRAALKTQGDALDRLMHATDGLVHATVETGRERKDAP
jgi:hypothetical protein